MHVFNDFLQNRINDFLPSNRRYSSLFHILFLAIVRPKIAEWSLCILDKITKIVEAVSYTHLRAPRDQRGSRMPSSA